MDDVPCMTWGEQTPFDVIQKANDKILRALTDSKIPVAIFINEQGLAEDAKRIALLKQWLTHPLITAGNHTFSHLNAAEIPQTLFEKEVLDGETLTRKILSGTGKPLKYFRFPFNASGKDSVSIVALQSFLNKHGYISTPFTIESSDYMFQSLYQQAIDKKDSIEARRVTAAYIAHTLELFDHFERLSLQRYGRVIPQIYLCHDNKLNADCLGELAAQIKSKGYSFTNLDTALQDKAYQQTDYYYGPYGFSWFFRWEKDKQKRKLLLQQQPEPSPQDYAAYRKLLK
jgi:hypothetical protein